jgi:hypothetical protein
VGKSTRILRQKLATKSFLSLIALILSSQVKKESRERLNLHLCVCVRVAQKVGRLSIYGHLRAACLRPDLWKRLFTFGMGERAWAINW